MKKFFAILIAICMLAGVLCVPTFAANDAPADGVVLRIRAQRKDGTIVTINNGDHTNFEDGWEAVVDYAEDTKTMKANGYDRVVVDFYADWTANDDGEFGSGGDGFEWSTIHITEDIRITLNLNNHTINRNLKEWEYDGEVIYIDENADVIINNGTISGGWSCNGAGGLHICNKAKVVLNNVNIVNNNVDDDDGAGIAVYKGAILTMNGGSFQNNVTDGVDAGAIQGAAVYVENGTATFNDVSFKNNQSFITYAAGTAIYATGSTVAVNNCTFEENGIKNTEKKFTTPTTLISASASSMTIKNSSFKGNGCYKLFSAEDSEFIIEGCQITENRGSELFTIRDSNGDIKDVTITGNTLDIFFIADSEVDVTNATIRDNVGQTLYIHNDDSEMVTLTNCTLGNNTHPTEGDPDVYIVDDNIVLVFVDCTLGDTSFNDEDLVKVVYSGVAKDDAAIGVTKLLADGTKETTYYRFFEYGWNLAIEAVNTNEYERIIVDLYDDWNAVDGQFTDEFNNGAGFDWDAIYIPADAKITLNMNGHTINRGLTDNEANGEVIYIGTGADVIINGGSEGDAIARGDNPVATFGTITGGNSHNGAGGIHINDNAMVVLNNVRVHGNRVEDDDGSGIAVYDGATLIMNGGSISNNKVDHSGCFYGESYGGLFVSDASAELTDVLITDNGLGGLSAGAAVYIKDGNMTMKNCYVLKNGYHGGPNEYRYATSIICAVGSSSVLDITDSTFENNGAEGFSSTKLFAVYDATLKINNSEFINNCVTKLLLCDDALVEITKTGFKGNSGAVFEGEAKTGSHFTECTFSENTSLKKYVTFYFYNGNELNFENCDFGNSTFNDRSKATFDGVAGVGSIFGEGSLSMIVAIIALITSGVSIFLIVNMKKKLVPATASNDEETENEE